MQNYFFFRKPESIVKEMFACVSVYFFCVDFAICFTLFVSVFSILKLHFLVKCLF